MKHKFFFIVFLPIFVVISLLAATNKLIPHPNPKAAVTSAIISLEPYCKDGYYKIPAEINMICSRAPHCGGYGYSELNTADKMPNPQKCMGDNGGKGRGCNGWVPLCCYEMARTGDYKKCIGYWERLWCTPSQCEEAKDHGASNSQCGSNGCLCGHAFKTYCGNKLPIPIEIRLKGELSYGAPYNGRRTPPLPPQHPNHTPTPKQYLPSSTPIPTPTIAPRPTTVPTPTKFTPLPTRIPTQRPPHYLFPSPMRNQPRQLTIIPTKKIIKTHRLPQLPSIDTSPLKKTFHKTTNTIKKPVVKAIKIDRTIERTINQFFLKLISLF